MKFECDNCGASYKIADEKVGERGVKVRCKKCEHVIIVRPLDAGAEAEQTTAGEPVVDDTEQQAEAPQPDSVFGTDEGQKDPAWDEPTKVGGGDAAALRSMARAEDAAADGVDDVFGGGADDEAGTDAGDVFGASDDESAADDGAFAGSVSPELAQAAGAADDGLGEGGLDDGGEDVGGFDDEEETRHDMAGGDPAATEADGGVAAAEAAALAALGGVETPDLGPSPFAPSADDEPAGDAGGGDTALGAFDEDDDDGGAGEDVPDPAAWGGDLGGDGDVPDPAAFGGDFGGDGDVPDPAAMAGQMPAVDEGEPPAPDALSMPDPGAAAMPDPDGGGGSDGLDLQLEGAFSNMFGQLPDGDPNEPVPEPAPLADPFAQGAPNPTALINMNEMDQLRQDAMPSQEGFGDDDAEDTDGWHVAIDDEDHGPMLLSEVKQHIQRGDVDPESLVWRSGMPDWAAARDVPELASLFSSLPMPSLSELDVGAPIDDVGASPFSGGGDPFSQVPDAPGNDPNWQPHGLTEVYAAANLAEAAGASVSIGTGGLGSGLAAESAVDAPSSSDSGGGGWSPGAASALQSLVNDELARIDDHDTDQPLAPAEGGVGGLDLPPGSGLLAEAGISLDESSPALADGGPAGPSPFGASASMPYAPATQSSAAFPAASASMPYAQGPSQSMPFAPPPRTGSMPFVGPPGTGSMAFAPSPPPAKRSPLFYAGLAGGGLLALLLIIPLFKIAFFGTGGDEPAGTAVAAAEAPADKGEAPADPSGAQPAGDPAPEGGEAAAEADKNDEEAKAEAEAKAKAEAEAEAEAKAKAEAEAKADEKDKDKSDTKVASAAKADDDDDDDNKRRRRRSSSKRHSRSSKSKASSSSKKDDDDDKSKRSSRSTRKSSSKDCDPVLDFDCDEKKSSRKKVKASLTKADILSVVKKKISRINSCGKKHGGTGKTVKVKWNVQESGRTSNVSVATSSVSGTPLGRCLTNEVKRWRFPAYKSGGPVPITFPFKLK